MAASAVARRLSRLVLFLAIMLAAICIAARPAVAQRMSAPAPKGCNSSNFDIPEVGPGSSASQLLVLFRFNPEKRDGPVGEALPAAWEGQDWRGWARLDEGRAR